MSEFSDRFRCSVCSVTCTSATTSTFCVTAININSREVAEGPHVVWMDNFDKTYYRKVPLMRSGTLSACYWTGIAYRRVEGDIDCALRYDAADALVHGMPQDPFAPDIIGSVTNLMLLRVPADGQMPNLLETSMWSRWDVNVVPVKPDLKRIPREDRKLKPRIAAAALNLKEFFPCRLALDNIGSNKGLARLMKAHHDEYKMNTEVGVGRYLVMTVDCNIFDRIVKVHDSRPTINTPNGTQPDTCTLS